MRMFHQCPVCHKKYANALVLQQHIRTHTGEPTELSPEQIAAAEIKDFPPQLPFPLPVSLASGVSGLPGLPRLPGSGLFPGFPGQILTPGGLSSESQSPDLMMGSEREDRDSNEDKDNSRPSSVSSSNSSMKNASFPTMTSMPSNIEAFIRDPIQ